MKPRLSQEPQWFLFSWFCLASGIQTPFDLIVHPNINPGNEFPSVFICPGRDKLTIARRFNAGSLLAPA